MNVRCIRRRLMVCFCVTFILTMTLYAQDSKVSWASEIRTDEIEKAATFVARGEAANVVIGTDVAAGTTAVTGGDDGSNKDGGVEFPFLLLNETQFSLVLIAGTSETGHDLVVLLSTFLDDMNTVYQWKSAANYAGTEDVRDIDGANEVSYTLTTAEEGRYVFVVASQGRHIATQSKASNIYGPVVGGSKSDSDAVTQTVN